MQNFKYNLATLKFNAYKILEYEILSINHNYQSNVMFPLSSRSPVRLQWQEKSKNQRCPGNIYWQLLHKSKKNLQLLLN